MQGQTQSWGTSVVCERREDGKNAAKRAMEESGIRQQRLTGKQCRKLAALPRDAGLRCFHRGVSSLTQALTGSYGAWVRRQIRKQTCRLSISGTLGETCFHYESPMVERGLGRKGRFCLENSVFRVRIHEFSLLYLCGTDFFVTKWHIVDFRLILLHQ